MKTKGKVKLVPLIKVGGYPTNHRKYNRCHKIANIEEKKLTGEVYVQRHKKCDRASTREHIADNDRAVARELCEATCRKKGTLLGSHTKDGKTILVSKIVPLKKRKNVVIHERFEHKCMTKVK